MSINWYPGHMTAARRKMQEDIKLCDIVIELLDARIPFSSSNPDIKTLANNKKRLIILNKSDMADSKVTESWIDYFKNQNIMAIPIDARVRKQTITITNAVRETCKDKLERDKKRGIAARPIKAMIVGIPNVGKSTFINSYVGKTAAKTGNKPGVTRGNQWIRISKDINLLDTPGILWPKFDDPEIGYRLASIGSINDDILEMRDIAMFIIDFMQSNYCNVLKDRYMIMDGLEKEFILGVIADNKKCVKKGGEPDIDKAAKLLIDDLRSGNLGRISLENPESI
ncbi:MAG: ribosome biogenesis GTPase YlqF [Eubacterium sp.]|nr:ribosome biogenesis GTPase YlqF [Eubacterium sp.]